MSVPHNAVLNPSGAFAISSWFNATLIDPSTNSGDMLVSKGDWNGINSYSFSFYNGGGGDILRCNIGNEWFAGPTYASSNFSVGKWYHVVCMADSKGHRLYVNGNLVASSSLTPTTVTDTAEMDIGELAFSPGNYSFFTGAIDDVRVYNHVLSPDEIKRLYQMGGTLKLNATSNSLTKGLVGWWTFDGKVTVHLFNRVRRRGA